MKTKNQELEILDNAIMKLGSDSYLGPWLQGIRHELQAMMAADCFPCVNLAESRFHAEKIMADAQRKADSIIADAKIKESEIIDAADTDRQRVRARIIATAENIAAIAGRV